MKDNVGTSALALTGKSWCDRGGEGGWNLWLELLIGSVGIKMAWVQKF